MNARLSVATLFASGVLLSSAAARAESVQGLGTCDRVGRTVSYTQTHDENGTVIPRDERRRVVVRGPEFLGRSNVAWLARDGRDFGARFYGCFYGARGRAHRPLGLLLDANSSGAAITDRFVDAIALDGRYAAYFIHTRGEEANYDEVRSVDLRTGEVRRDSGRLAQAGYAYALVLVASTNGAIAWFYSADGTLRATDAEGTRVLASSSAGKITDVTLGAATVRWVQAGARHAAVLH